MKKVELLAPAGNFQCLQAAINAGADAVYLGGSKFGARAFADNFSEEELMKGIHYAHLFGVRIFLTVNTLVKEKEFSGLYEYIKPLYEAGLDGVIIQDIGVFQFLKKSFPGLELHASTQMTLTGVHGAKLLKEMGACRIVPARELSLEDVRDISSHVDIDIECFIHGAMCYCYSGQCLFSSILGGRSGNRGRCAGPCRLPFQVGSEIALLKQNQATKTNGRNKDFSKYGNKKDFSKEQYPLSLKDMCTIDHIGDLIEAGITSFKIEGRMKSPEYVAGVTSIYRKYIDLYYETGKSQKVDASDLQILNTLYIRSDRHNGYYYKHNGKEMITLNSPAYAGANDQMVKDIHDRFLLDNRRLPVDATFYAKENEEMVLTLMVPDRAIVVCVTGAVCQVAQNRPMGKEDFLKQLLKTKDTCFDLSDIQIELGNSVFVPVKEVNALRRLAFDQLMEEFIRLDGENRVPCATENTASVKGYDTIKTALSCLVQTDEQLSVVKNSMAVKRIYVDFSLAVTNHKDFLKESDREWYLVLPYVFRRRSEKLMEQLFSILKEGIFDGVLVRSMDELGFLKENDYKGHIQLDASMYVWNQETKSYYAQKGYDLTLPYELNQHELRTLSMKGMEAIVYGRIPMMITANCIYKTYDQCNPVKGYRKLVSIKDRYEKELPVLCNCTNCYNVIYNSQILSLHKQIGTFVTEQVSYVRLQFLDENATETQKMIDGFSYALSGVEDKVDRLFANMEFTNGHYKRGVD